MARFIQTKRTITVLNQYGERIEIGTVRLDADAAKAMLAEAATAMLACQGEAAAKDLILTSKGVYNLTAFVGFEMDPAA